MASIQSPQIPMSRPISYKKTHTYESRLCDRKHNNTIRKIPAAAPLGASLPVCAGENSLSVVVRQIIPSKVLILPKRKTIRTN